MTTEEAIKILEDTKVNFPVPKAAVTQIKRNIALDRAIDVLSNCSEIPNNWIPCSEQLPEKDGRYLVTRHDDVTRTEFIDILWYEENLWWNRLSTGDYAVTAWMSLPTPYQPKEDES